MPSAASLSGSAFQCESPELASAKRRAAEVAVVKGLELVDEGLQRRPVAETEAAYVEGAAEERAEPRLAALARDAFVHADERREQAAQARDVPDAVEVAHG